MRQKTYAAYYSDIYGSWRVIVAETPLDGDSLAFRDYADEIETGELAKGLAMFKNWEQRQDDYEDPEGNNG